MNELRERVIDALAKHVYANGLPASRDEFAPVADAVLAALGDGSVVVVALTAEHIDIMRRALVIADDERPFVEPWTDVLAVLDAAATTADGDGG